MEAITTRAADIVEIMNLHSRYNLWLELGWSDRIWNELFPHKDPCVKCELVEGGVYEGPESVKRLWMSMAEHKPPREWLPNLQLTTPCIVVSKDGKTAKGMWLMFGPHAMYVTPYPGDQQKLTAYWFLGKYDDEFVKEDGKWKFLYLHAIAYFRIPYEQGWLKQPDCRRWPIPEDAPPDKPSTLLSTYHPDGYNSWLPVPPEEIN